MNPRFPSVETIVDSLGDNANLANYHARAAGAFRGIYSIATREFDILRGLATAALSGHPDNMAALRDYLKVQEDIAELYFKERQHTEVRLPKTRQ